MLVAVAQRLIQSKGFRKQARKDTTLASEADMMRSLLQKFESLEGRLGSATPGQNPDPVMNKLSVLETRLMFHQMAVSEEATGQWKCFI